MNGLSDYEAKAMRQLENMTGLRAKIDKENKKKEPRDWKVKVWEKELRCVKRSFERTQITI